MYELMPKLDRRKSFYGKAHVFTEGDRKILRSYETDVAEIRNGTPFIHGWYSATTTRHIKDFFHQEGLRVGSKKDMEKWYRS